MSVKNVYRDMIAVGESQERVEQLTVDKFADAQRFIQQPTSQIIMAGRISPQICCTITSEDKELLDALMKHVTGKKGRVIKTSELIRSLIRLGSKYKEVLEL